MRRFAWLFAFLCAPAVVAVVGCPPDNVELPKRDSAVCSEYDFGLAEPEVGADADADADADGEAEAEAETETEADGGAETTDASADGSEIETTPNDSPKICRTDVDAIFYLSCAFSTCHGESPNGQKGLFIDKSGARDWVPFVVNAKSTERPDMVRVAPGDPSNSWLAHKIVGDQCAFSSRCADGDCGDQMPATNQPLNDSDMNTILQWIRQGADPDPTCGGTK